MIYDDSSIYPYDKSRRMFAVKRTSAQDGYQFNVVTKGLADWYIQPDIGPAPFSTETSQGYGICCYYDEDLHLKDSSGNHKSVYAYGVRGETMPHISGGQFVTSTAIANLYKDSITGNPWAGCSFGLTDAGVSTRKLEGALYKRGTQTYDARLHRRSVAIEGPGWGEGSTGIYTLDRADLQSGFLLAGGWTAIVACTGCNPIGYDVVRRYTIGNTGTWSSWGVAGGSFARPIETVEQLVNQNGVTIKINVPDESNWVLYKVTNNIHRPIFANSLYGWQFAPLLIMQVPDGVESWGCTLMAQYMELVDGNLMPTQ